MGQANRETDRVPSPPVVVFLIAAVLVVAAMLIGAPANGIDRSLVPAVVAAVTALALSLLPIVVAVYAVVVLRRVDQRTAAMRSEIRAFRAAVESRAGNVADDSAID